MSILYDSIEAVGGAERVSILMANHFERDLIVNGVDVKILQRLPELKQRLTSLSPIFKVPVFKTLWSIHKFSRINSELLSKDVNLFSGSNALQAVHHSKALRNIYYCHTPPRFAYDLQAYYKSELNPILFFIVSLLGKYVRKHYENAMAKMDFVISNSSNTQKRLEKFLGIKSEVIFPPVECRRFYSGDCKGYYLSTARLENYKRVDMIVKAFTKMPSKNLVVLSGGSQFSKLSQIASQYSNITMLGWQSDEQYAKLLSNAIASIYIPIDEDFGVSPVESMAAGKPVISVNDGGPAESIIHGETGWLCNKDITVGELIGAVTKVTEKWSSERVDACKKRAEMFSENTFFEKMSPYFCI